MARYSAEHNAQSHAAIRSSAARLFRAHGFEGVGIDQICRDAGLTRGTFYSHFASKAALLTEVLTGAHDLITRLRARTARSTNTLRKEALRITRQYLDPDNRSAVIGGCSLASLAIDSARAGGEAQAAYSAAVATALEELQRGQGEQAVDADDARAALAMCVGALLINSGCGGDANGEQVARAASRRLKELLG